MRREHVTPAMACTVSNVDVDRHGCPKRSGSGKAGACALGVALCLAAAPLAAAEGGSANFIGRKGEPLGTAVLAGTPNGVLIIADLHGLPPGEHAFHIHERGECDPKGGFQSAGGHFHLPGQAHGYLNPAGPHAGDMPNQFVSDNGVLRTHVINPRVSVRAGDDGYLFDADGSAFVIHAGADDYRSQPAGDAGDRIACAVIEPVGGR